VAADEPLAGQVAIVTGAGTHGDGIGNGRAAAILLARRGAKVAVVDTRTDYAAVTRDVITREGHSALVLTGDVSTAGGARDIVDQTVAAWGTVDILVNNVGISGPPETAVNVDLEAWDAALRTNVTSMMLMARYVIPHMIAAGGGAIVNLASIAGYRGVPQLLYSTSKGAVINMTRSMAVAHGPDGIRVNCVAPGHVYTPMVSGMSDESREHRRITAPLRTEGTGWDTGYAVAFLAGPDSRWITGIMLPVDGGIGCIMPS
jgi:NAD(P)-dependent dehydrogenase (short-subunit alcohol dehydrogenase family)